MMASINVDLNGVSDVSKITIINDEWLKLNVDITILQETRLINAIRIKLKNSTLYLKAKKQ